MHKPVCRGFKEFQGPGIRLDVTNSKRPRHFQLASVALLPTPSFTYCNAVPGARCCVNTDKSNRATNRGSWELPLGQLPGKCDRSAGVTCPCPAPSWVSVKASVLGQFLRYKGPA